MPSEKHYETIILGAGFSGICAAVKLQEAGRSNFVVFEKGRRVGGTWFENSYPGAECDVESHLYSFSFYAKHDWRRVFSDSRDIRDYMEDCVHHFQLMNHFQLGVRVVSADWIEEKRRWRIVTESSTNEGEGERTVHYARFFICSFAPLHVPVIPQGLKDYPFGKDVIHTAQWREPKGPTVAVVGNGASGIQLIPQLAKREEIKKLLIFQRTPNWVVPKLNRSYLWIEKLLFRIPLVRHLTRYCMFAYHESFFFIFRKKNWFAPWMEFFSKLYVRWMVKDKTVAEKLIPKYPIGCKRILLSDDYFQSFNNPKVQLVTESIADFTEKGITTSSGKEYAVDSFVVATGYDLRGTLRFLPIRGRQGVSLMDTRWKEHPEALLGTFVDGFPNLFLLAGPNSGTAHISLVLYIEAQMNAVMKVLKEMDECDFKVCEVKREAVKKYCGWLNSSLKEYVWDQCNSWYLFFKGKNAVLYPQTVRDFERKTENLELRNFEFA